VAEPALAVLGGVMGAGQLETRILAVGAARGE
jgi:hypothetical protein